MAYRVRLSRQPRAAVHPSRSCYDCRLAAVDVDQLSRPAIARPRQSAEQDRKCRTSYVRRVLSSDALAPHGRSMKTHVRSETKHVRDAVQWFDASAPALSPLRGRTTADVVVVGGGMMGLMCARTL